MTMVENTPNFKTFMKTLSTENRDLQNKGMTGRRVNEEEKKRNREKNE